LPLLINNNNTPGTSSSFRFNNNNNHHQTRSHSSNHHHNQRHTYHHMDADSLSSFQFGYYTLFKGEFKLENEKEKWMHTMGVNEFMSIKNQILMPAVHMGLRLHQDHFQTDTQDEKSLHANIVKFDKVYYIDIRKNFLFFKLISNNFEYKKRNV
jgi:hypothetical protein